MHGAGWHSQVDCWSEESPASEQLQAAVLCRQGPDAGAGSGCIRTDGVESSVCEGGSRSRRRSEGPAVGMMMEARLGGLA